MNGLAGLDGPGDFATQAPGGGGFDPAAIVSYAPGAGGYIDAPAASQESSQTDAARAERDRLAAAEAARIRAENERRWAEEDAAAEAARLAEEERNRQVRVGGTVVVDDRDAGGRLSATRATSAEGGEVLSASEAARRSVEATAAARRHDEDLRRAREEANSPLARVLDPLGLFRGAGGGLLGRALGGSEGNGGLANILTGGLLGGGGAGGGAGGLLGMLTGGMLGSGSAADLIQRAQLAESGARQVADAILSGVNPDLDAIRRQLSEDAYRVQATAEHRLLTSEEDFRRDVLARVDALLSEVQALRQYPAPSRW